MLDADNAAKLPHRDIAILLHGKHGVADWWAQMVTVGYERIKGLRDRGQRRGGGYETTKSKTINVPVTALFRAWEHEATRRRWLDGVKASVRSSTAPKAMRLQWPDGTVVIAGFTPKGDAKSMVALAHTKLPDKESAARSKQVPGPSGSSRWLPFSLLVGAEDCAGRGASCPARRLRSNGVTDFLQLMPAARARHRRGIPAG